MPNPLSAKFIYGVPDPEDLKFTPHPEIAVIGRSNVGKSSFVNRLTGQKNLARASATPGRTQEFNVFEVITSSQRKKRSVVYLVDLPGYGFAKFTKTDRETLNQRIVGYIRERENLKMVCLLIDCRRDAERDDQAIVELVADRDIALIVALTKVDKLSRSEWLRRKKIAAEQLGISEEFVIESGEGIPVQAFWGQALKDISSEES